MAFTTDDISLLKQMFRESEDRMMTRMDGLEQKIEDTKTELQASIADTEKRLTDLIELKSDMVDQKIKAHEAKYHAERIV